MPKARNATSRRAGASKAGGRIGRNKTLKKARRPGGNKPVTVSTTRRRRQGEYLLLSVRQIVRPPWSARRSFAGVEELAGSI